MAKMSREQLRAPARKYSALITGAPKSGKTFSHRTWYYWMRDTKQPYKRVYVYDFDKGAESLIQIANAEGWIDDLEVFRYSVKGGDKISPETTPTRSMEQFNEFMEEFNSLFDKVDPRTGDWKDSFKEEAPGLLMFDSISAIQNILFDFILIMSGNAGNAKINEFGSFSSKVIEIIESARDLPCHCSFIAHEEPRQRTASAGSLKIDAVPTDGRVYVVPAIIGSLRWTLQRSFDISLYSDLGYKWKTSSTHDMKGIGVRTMQKLAPIIDQDFRTILKAGVVTRAETAAERLAAQSSGGSKPVSTGPAMNPNLKVIDANLKPFEAKPTPPATTSATAPVTPLSTPPAVDTSKPVAKPTESK